MLADRLVRIGVPDDAGTIRGWRDPVGSAGQQLVLRGDPGDVETQIDVLAIVPHHLRLDGPRRG